MILMINSMHLIRDDDMGLDLLFLIQQRAEAWAASGICTVILNSDDYWYASLEGASKHELTELGFTSD